MKKYIMAIVIFIFLILIMTFPLVFKISTHIPGFFSTEEPYTTLWDSWRIKHSLEHKFSLRYTSLVTYPFGDDLYASGYSSYLWKGLAHSLSIVTSPVLCYNLQAFFNLFFSGIFTYLLAFYLTRNKGAAILSGIIFTFCPYQFACAWQHLGLTYNQWIPLCLFIAILLKEKESKKYLVLFFVSLFLLLSFDFSVMYLGAVALSIFVLYIIFYHWKLKLFKHRGLFKEDFRYIKSVIVAVFIAVVILSPQFLPVIKNRIKLSGSTQASGYNPYHRPFDDLFAQSAKPLGYLLPATFHPIFGKFTTRFIGSDLWGVSFTMHQLYLGWTPLILSFIAIRNWRRRRKNYKSEILNPKSEIITNDPSASLRASQLPVTNKDDFYIGFFIFLAVVAWLFSQPPWWRIGAFKIYMPSFFMYKILPMYRAYCRFGIVVMLAVSVLAGYGLKTIISNIKYQISKILIASLFCGLVLFEFWSWPPLKVINVSKAPQVYYWLKEKPGNFAIAEYPLDADGPNIMYGFYQIKHEKKIINWTTPGTYANKVAKTIVKLSEPRTSGVLKWMGVKYALVHRDGYLDSGLVEVVDEFKKIPQNGALRLIKTFPPQECPSKIMCTEKTGAIDVYEILADPIEPIVKEE